MSGIARKLMGVTKGAGVDPAMILVFDTTLATGTTVTVPLAGTVNVVVDWGDGASDVYATAGDRTHTYASEGEYTVRVSGSLTQFGGLVSRPNLIKCLSFGDLGITSLFRAFFDCANLTEVPESIPPSVTNMSGMFVATSAFNQNIGTWNVVNVTDMSSMFGSTQAFNQDIGAWDVSNVTNMSGMFQRASAFNQNIGAWNVANVTNMGRMFFAASAMTYPLGAWQTNHVDQPFSFSTFANATFASFSGTANFPLLADGVTRINT